MQALLCGVDRGEVELHDLLSRAVRARRHDLHHVAAGHALPLGVHVCRGQKLPGHVVPVLGEYKLEVACGRALDHYVGVAPVAPLWVQAQVLVADVDAAGVCGLPVGHHYLPVVPEVRVQRPEPRETDRTVLPDMPARIDEGGEEAGLDAFRAEVVVQEPDLDPGPRTLGERVPKRDSGVVGLYY